jgi:very-short-patch-repair endonuclease
MRPKLHARGAKGGERAVIDTVSADRAIAELAGRQRGVVTRAQLLAAGIEASAIERRRRAGRLHAVHRGIYLVGHRAMAAGAREAAALLACGDGAVVSHLSAAHLLQLLPYPANRRPVDIAVSGRQGVPRPGIRIHRVKALDQRDVNRIDGLPVTTAARTLLDLAAVLPSDLLERAAAEAQVRRLVRRRDLVDQLERNQGRRGVRALRELLDERGAAPTRSEAERRLLRLIRSADLATPEVNARVGRYEVDFLWRAERLVVEVDGFAYHANRRAFESDRRRDATLAASGYMVLRVTWRQIVDAPEAVIARIAATLAVRRTDVGE